MNTRFGLFILRLALGLVIGGYSLELVLHQIHSRTHHPLLLLALAELVAAILFLLPKTMRLGGIALIVVFVIAAAFHILHGEYNVWYLAIYGAAALAVISEERRA